jgi:hypothetical protein
VLIAVKSEGDLSEGQMYNHGAGAAIAAPIQGIADGARNDMETPSHSTAQSRVRRSLSVRWHRFNWRDTKSLANVPVVYVLYSRGRVIYVGQTNDLRRRFSWYRFKWHNVDAAKGRIVPVMRDRLALERRMVRRLKPSENIQHTGIFRPRRLRFAR